MQNTTRDVLRDASMTDWRILTFSFGVLWIAYVYLGYPLLLALIGIVKRAHPESRDDYSPSVSVLIAARNEEKDIGWKVRETLAWKYPPDRLEVLVASDASEDGTDDIVRSLETSRLKFLRLTARGGKNRALNELARGACGELLFFTDANAHIDSEVLTRMTRHFADPRVGCVTGSTSAAPLLGDDESVARGAACYWRYESLLQYLESRIGSVLVCDGAIFCIRGSLFRPLIPEIANDLQTPMDVAGAGFWVIYEPRARVIEADTSCPRQELNRRRRICGQGAFGLLRLSDRISRFRKWQFVSHKLLRWLTLVPMLMGFISSLALARKPIFSALLAIQIAFYVIALLGWVLSTGRRSAPRWISIPFYVVLGVSGALLGILDTAFGRRFAVWEIPTLSRGHEGA
jgi:cellulose synthase/poly-beta-1,6-N-acetylglucosamine synthase-like glycosyltransferase